MSEEPEWTTIMPFFVGPALLLIHRQIKRAVHHELTNAGFRFYGSFGLKNFAELLGKESKLLEGQFPTVQRSHINAHGDRIFEYKIKKSFFSRYVSTFLCVLSSRKIPALETLKELHGTPITTSNATLFILESDSQNLKQYQEVLRHLV